MSDTVIVYIRGESVIVKTESCLGITKLSPDTKTPFNNMLLIVTLFSEERFKFIISPS